MLRWTLLVACLLSACTPRHESDETLHRRLNTRLDTLHPLLATSRSERLVATYLFTPLVRLDRDAQPVPGLAIAWSVAPDLRRYTFTLHPRATFSDGTRVRATDVLFTLGEIASPTSRAVQISSYFDQLDLTCTRALDEHTIVVCFKEARAAQLRSFSKLPIIPAHVYGRGAADMLATVAVGSGPYRLAERSTNGDLLLQRRNDYWEERPAIARVRFHTITEQATAWRAVLRGDIDETSISSDLWVREQGKHPHLRFHRFFTRSYNFIAWNNERAPFNDPRVRQALTLCIDQERINESLFQGTARTLNGPFMPDETAVNPDVPPRAFNPERARALLHEAGWRDTDRDGTLDQKGQPLAFEFIVMNASASSIAQLLQANWRRIGVAMVITTMDPATAIRHILDGQYHAAYLAAELDPTPDLFNALHSTQIPPHGNNIARYSNKTADHLIHTARTATSQTARDQAHQQLHTLLAHDQPYTWMNQAAHKWVTNTRVTNIHDSPTLGLFGWHPGELAWVLTGD